MRELRQRFFLRLTTWMTLTACFTVLAAAALAAINLSRVLTLWGEDLQITAYVQKEADHAHLQNIEDRLRNDPRVGRWSFVTQEKSLENFRAQMASYAPDLANDEELFSLIPPSFQISLSDKITATKQADTIADVAKGLQGMAGVEEVRYGQDWVKKYGAILSALDGAAGLIGFVLIAAALLVIGNAVRASVDARRQEVEVLELVGATPWMIRKPFLAEGALLGFSSTTAAIIAAAVAFAFLRGLVTSELQFLQLANELRFFSMPLIVATVAGGMVLGALASYLCVRRINGGWAAAEGLRA